MGIIFLEGRKNRKVWIEQPNFERELILGIFYFRKVLWYRQGAQRVKNIGNEEYRTRTERQNRFQNIFSADLRGTVVTRCVASQEFRVAKNRKIGKIIFFRF